MLLSKLEEIRQVLLEEVALEADPPAEGFHAGVELAAQAYREAVARGWSPKDGMLPAPLDLEEAVSNGFCALTVALHAAQ